MQCGYCPKRQGQWRLNRIRVIWADRLVQVNILAAEFWIYCKREMERTRSPEKNQEPYIKSRQDVLNA